MQEVQGNSIFIENFDSGRLSERKQARGRYHLNLAVISPGDRQFGSISGWPWQERDPGPKQKNPRYRDRTGA
jgi:hypothetical protein